MDAPAANDLTRRDFTKTAAAVAAAPLLISLAACGGATAAPPPTSAPAAAATVSAGTGNGARPDPVADALAEVVRERYGERLSVEELDTVRGSIRSNLGAARRLRDFRLPISTEPVLGIPVPPPTAA